MFLRDVSLPKPSLKVSHLLKHESTVWQTPERFFIRLERPVEIAQNAVAIDALREPRFPELGLERHRPIRGLLHCSSAVLVQINSVKIQLASRDGEAGPCQRELRIKPNRLDIKVSGPLCRVEGELRYRLRPRAGKRHTRPHSGSASPQRLFAQRQ